MITLRLKIISMLVDTIPLGFFRSSAHGIFFREETFLFEKDFDFDYNYISSGSKFKLENGDEFLINSPSVFMENKNIPLFELTPKIFGKGDNTALYAGAILGRFKDIHPNEIAIYDENIKMLLNKEKENEEEAIAYNKNILNFFRNSVEYKKHDLTEQEKSLLDRYHYYNSSLDKKVSRFANRRTGFQCEYDIDYLPSFKVFLDEFIEWVNVLRRKKCDEYKNSLLVSGWKEVP